MSKKELTSVDLGRRGLHMNQLKDGFRFGTDTVLLSWFTACAIKDEGVRSLELGANCGACSFLLYGRRPKTLIDSVEIDADAFDVLKDNIALNGLEGSITAYKGDVRDLPKEIRDKQYDVVFMNPPFFTERTGPVSSRTGRCEINGTLSDFIKAGASRLVPSGGIMTLVMTSSRTDELIELMGANGIKPIRFMSVHPFSDKNAEMVLIAGKKTNTKTNLEIMPPLILNERDGETGKVFITSRLKDIYEKEQEDCFIW